MISYLMFVPDNSGLVWYLHFDHGISIQNNTLATKARFQAGIDRSVNKVFFFVRNFLQKIFARLDVHMASTARAYAPAVVVEMNVIFLCYFQYGIAFFYIFNRDSLYIFIFKCKLNNSHRI